jgi:RNA polymerase sigma factor (sigma-70 family)
MSVSTRGIFEFLARLRPVPAADSDAELLDRFVRTHDGSAFAGIVHRHGPMVLSICHRRLGREADAEDAFQAVFLALANSARSISRRESLPGWLYRVAYLVALKAAGRRARQPVTRLPAEVPMPDPPPPACETDELKAVIDAEVAALPDKFRAVIVLCLIEGHTSADAAAVLGVPVGTIDSRLSAARKKLQDRLSRRGVAVGLGITLEQMLDAPVQATGPRLFELVSSTVSAVLTEVAGPGIGAVSPGVVDLARGVTMLTTMNARVLAVLGIALGLLGSAGAGIYIVTAGEPAKPVAKAAEPKVLLPAVAEDKVVAPPAAAAPDGPKGTAAALDKPIGNPLAAGVPMKELLDEIEDKTELIVRVDVAAFRRIGVVNGNAEEGTPAEQLLQAIYETKPVLPRKAEKLPIRDVLADALAQVRLSHPCTYQVRGNQLVIVPAFIPPMKPGVNPLDPSDDDPMLVARMLNEQIYGGVVSVTADRKPLADILFDLRKQTGANIVLDPRCDMQEKKATLSITLSDVRLYDALRVIADMAELKMVYAGNIYYVTTAANAATFQPEPRQPSGGVQQLPRFGGK